MVSEERLDEISIDFGRCLCVHSMLQMVDINLQLISFSRGFIPVTFQQLSKDTSPKAQGFQEVYTKVSGFLIFVLFYFQITSHLKEVFRSANRKSVREVQILLGNNVFAPVVVYKINVRPCCRHEESSLSENLDPEVTIGCSENCGTLDKR